jgi:Flp pilus assembly pilin Flp
MNRFGFSDEKGQGLAEYGLLLTAVALTAVGILSLLGVRVSDVICQVAAGIGTEAVCDSTLFADEFNQGMEKWHSFYKQDKNWTVTQDDDPQLCHTGSGGDFLLANDSESDNYRIATKANLTSGNGYGVFFRANETEDGRLQGYTLQYDPAYRGGQFIMRKWVNGYELWPPFASATPPAGFDWHNVDRHIEIDVQDDTFTTYIDGKEVLRAQDETYATGGVGLRTWSSSRVCFDNFTVKSR